MGIVSHAPTTKRSQSNEETPSDKQQKTCQRCFEDYVAGAATVLSSQVSGLFHPRPTQYESLS